ncbi:hypothetical protein H0H81_001686 [Sphagnurus paluster]|uniref:ELYS-like domain-containing protein n=1 Tax=Sphagnurus paluster TaxID=117069 RepID=A0A9P7FTF6_9AGAR|nr:hypothetical protein H0H81_001686 [Sphagnurus paluster]
MNDKFIFDILLSSGGIEKPDTLFPPTNVRDLEALLLSIEQSTYDSLKKECLVYYLLKWHHDGREDRYQLERSIPPQFTSLADAYWHLDAGVNIPRAVSILSDNRLNREYASKILHAISISPNPSPLVVQYVRTAKPLLTEPQDVWTYTLALADSSLLEAWQYQRTFNEKEELRTQLLEKILDWCIFRTSHIVSRHCCLTLGTAEPRPTALRALLGLPLSPFEEQFLHKYALEPPQTLLRTSIAILRDLICVRLIQSGKYAEAIKADHQFASSTLNESKAYAQDRRKMVRDIYAALPLAERSLLDSELEGKPSTSKPAINGPVPKPKSQPNGDVSMSHSWEDVPRPPLAQPRPLINGVHMSSPGPILAPVVTSTSAVPPLLPISSNPKRASLPVSQSFPLTNTSAPARPQFFAPTGRKSLGGAFPVSQNQSQLPVQQPSSSASRKANAFYKPPAVPVQPPQRKAFKDVEMDLEPEETEPETEREEVRMDMDDVEDEEKSEKAFPVSVFGNRGKAPSSVSASTVAQVSAPPNGNGRAIHTDTAPARASQHQNGHAKEETREKQGKRMPPGAFHVSDDEEAEAEEEPTPLPAPAPTTRTRTSARGTTTQQQQPKRSARRSIKAADLGRSLPGSLMGEDEGLENGGEGSDAEDADAVPPLRAEPRRTGVRRARESTPGSDIGDDEGGPRTRRRSSRLSSVGASPPTRKSMGGAGASASTSTGAAKPRKSTRAVGGTPAKKKR